MAFSLPTVIPLGSKSRARHPSIYAGFDELYNNNDSGDRGGDNHHNLWVRVKQRVWGQYNPYNMTTAGSDFTLEVITRAASQVLEVTEIEREIDTTSTTVSLSVFSQ